MTLVNVSKRSATLFKLSLDFIFLLKLFRDQFYKVPNLCNKCIGISFMWKNYSAVTEKSDFLVYPTIQFPFDSTVSAGCCIIKINV